ncbi:copper chaperone PCu(A)C [soil metagenome]
MNKPRTRPRIILALTLAMMLTACGGDNADEPAAAGDGGNLVVSDAWARPAVLLDESDDMEHSESGEATTDASMADGTEMSGTNGVVYLTVENTGDVDDRLVSATTDLAGAVELHTVNMVEGVMQMRQVEDEIDVPAGSTIVFEPGGLHIMLIGLNQSLEPGDTFDIELRFEDSGSMAVEVEVREP